MMKNVLLTLILLWAAGAQARTETAPKWVENRGQIVDTRGEQRPEISHSIDLGWAQVFLSPQGLHYVLRQNGATPEAEARLLRVDARWEGANPNPTVVSGDASSETRRYLLGQASGAEISARSFASVTYRNLYDYIDLVVYAREEGGQRALKYDFVVRPGGDASQIRLKYQGLQSGQITREGALKVSTTFGEWIEEAPVSWYESNGQRQPAASRYDWRQGVLRFAVEGQANGRTLVIDPLTRTLATNYGGSSSDRILGTAVDAAGNVTVTGFTASQVFPTTAGVAQTVFAGQQDAFIARFNAAGQRVWATYYGGAGLDQGFAIAQAANGRTAVAGYTTSLNLPVSSAFQGANAGSGDGFLAYFNDNGTLAWATYYGGNQNDQLTGVAVSATSGDIYVCGRVFSNGLSTFTPNTVAGNRDMLAARFTAMGQRSWSAYYGGTQDDQANGVALGANDDVFVAGLTASAGLATAGAAQTTISGGNDALLVKFNASGQRQWATYHGGSGTDFANAVVALPNGGAAITGQTNSSNLTTLNAAQGSLGGLTDAFVAGYNATGGLAMSTYLGGGGTDQAFGAAYANGKVYVAGATNSANYPLKSPASPSFPLQSGVAGFLDVFVSSYTVSSGAQDWSIVYGGSTDDAARGLAASATGRLAVGGYTNSPNIPLQNAVAGQNPAGVGNDDAFLLVLDDPASTECPPVTVQTTTVNLTCPTLPTGQITVTAPTGANFRYSLTGAATRAEQSASSFEGLVAGAYVVRVRNTTNGCEYQSGSVVLTQPNVSTSVTAQFQNPRCADRNDGRITVVSPVGTGFLYELFVPGGNQQTSPVFDNLGVGSYVVRATGPDGCPSTSALIVLEAPQAITLQAQGNTIPCNSTAGVVQVTSVTGGVGALTFELNGPENRPVQNNGVFTALPEGDYTVIVRDVNGCSATTTATVTPENGPQITVTATPATCGQANGSISVTATGNQGTMFFLVEGPTSSPFLPFATFVNLLPGEYSVTGFDANTQCTASATVIVPNEISALLVEAVQLEGILCNGGTANMQLNILGGNAPYAVSINNGQPVTALSSPFLLQNVPGGASVITVTDNGGCSGSVSVNLTQPAPFVFDVNVTQIGCPLPETGTIAASATGGTQPYRFSVNNAPFAATSLFEGLAAGTYAIRALDGNNCPSTPAETTVVIAPIDRAQIVSLTATSPTCANGSDGTVTVTVSGVGPFRYVIGGRQPVSSDNMTFTFQNVSEGAYDVVVWDGNGCETSSTIAVNDPEPFIITNVLGTSPTSCTVGDGRIAIQTSGGVGTVWYSINGGITYQTSPVFDLIEGGYYHIVVRDRNRADNACVAETTYALNHRNAPQILGVIGVNPLCSNSSTGNNTGQIVINAVGSTSTLYYTINDGVDYFPSNTGSRTFTDLGAATYRIRVSTLAGCASFYGPLTLTAPPAIAVTGVSRVNPVCGTNPQSGSLSITAAGGTPPLNYSVDNGMTFSSSNTFTGLYPNGTAGYEVIVTDANGCRVPGGRYFMFNSSGLNINVAGSVRPTCGQNDGSITVQASGGTSPRFFSVNGGSESQTVSSAFMFTGLSDAIHTVRVRDNSNCIAETRVNLQTLVINATVQTRPTCGFPAPSDGAVNVSVLNGVGPFNYKIEGVAFDGTTEITVPSFGPNNRTQNFWNASNLMPGVYKVTVIDNGAAASTCAAETTIVVSSATGTASIASLLGFNRTCNAATATVDYGRIVVIGTGAVNQYYIQGFSMAGIPPNAANNALELTPVAAGTYRAFVQDINGCLAYGGSVTITEPAPIIITNVATVQPSCTSPTTGSVTVVATGGTNLEYTIDGGQTWSANPTFTGLSSGTQFTPNLPSPSIQAREVGTTVDQCRNFWPLQVAINNPSNMAVTNIVTTNSDCANQSRGTIQMDFTTTGLPPFTYTLNGQDVATGTNTTHTFTGIAPAGANVYTVGARDAAGCIAFTRVSVPILDLALDFTATTINATTCNNGRIRVDLVNPGAAPYRYSINGGSSFVSSNNTVRNFPNLLPGTYRVVVERGTGSSLCRVEKDVTVSGTSSISIISINGTNPSCQAGNDGSIVVTATFNNPNGVITIGAVSSAPFATAGTFSFSQTNLTPGVYAIQLTDGLCTVNDPALAVTLVNPQPIVMNAPVVTQIACGSSPALGSIQINVNNPQPSFIYSIDGGMTTQASSLFTNLSPGTYTLWARDVNSSCPAATWPVAITLAYPSGMELVSVTTISNSCAAVADASFTVNLLLPSASSYPVQYFVNNVLTGTLASPTTAFTVGNLTGGTYNIRIVDNFGCVIQTVVSIATEADLSIDLNSSQPTSCSSSSGSISFTVSGGNDVALGDREYRFTSNGVASPYMPVNAGSPSAPAHVLSGLSSGVYHLEARNTGQQCASNRTVLLQDPSGLSITGTTNGSASNAQCNNGFIQVNIAGSGLNIRYQISTDAFTWSALQSSSLFLNLQTGSYYVRVRTGVQEPFCYNYAGPIAIACQTGNRVEAEAAAAQEAFRIYPNPTRDLVSVEFDAKGEGVYSLEVIDLQGRTLHSRAVSATEGRNVFSLDLSAQASGMYLIRLTGAGINETSRIVKN